jgi:hypothetical protein
MAFAALRALPAWGKFFPLRGAGGAAQVTFGSVTRGQTWRVVGAVQARAWRHAAHRFSLVHLPIGYASRTRRPIIEMTVHRLVVG